MFKNYQQSTSKKLYFGLLTLLFMGTILILSSKNILALPSDIVYKDLTNNQREVNGLPSLTWSELLAASATAKAQDMCVNNYWAHTSPTGITGWTFMSQAGYKYITAGENLAKDFSSQQSTINAWMASPGHRANILNVNYSEIGVASLSCTIDGYYTTVVVAHYGAVIKPTQKVQIESTSSQKSTQSQPASVPKSTNNAQPSIIDKPIEAQADVKQSTSPKVVKESEISNINRNNNIQKNKLALLKLINNKIWHQSMTLLNQFGLAFSEHRVLGRLRLEL